MSGSSNNEPSAAPLWKEVSRKQGVRIIEVSDFEGFFQIATRGFGLHDSDLLWRGQSDASWEIESSLARIGRKAPDLLRRFRDAVARCTNVEFDLDDKTEAGEEAELRLWSLGQHHGLRTPLIDWTKYPFVALFFAFAENPTQSEARAVYALNWDEARGLNFKIVEPPYQWFRDGLNSPHYSEELKAHLHRRFDGKFGEQATLIDRSAIPKDQCDRLCRWELTRLKALRLRLFASRANENRRIHSQGGVHIFTKDDITVEEWGRRYESMHGPFGHGFYLTKIVIPSSARVDVIRGLNKMNINYLSIFPDLDGAARHCNMAVEERASIGLREY